MAAANLNAAALIHVPLQYLLGEQGGGQRGRNISQEDVTQGSCLLVGIIMVALVSYILRHV